MNTPVNTTPTPKSPKPQTRWTFSSVIFAILATIAVLILIAFGGAWVWSGSAGSLETALNLAARYQPIQASGIVGSLRGGGSVADLTWEQNGIRVHVRNAELSWQPLALINRTIKLDRLSAASIELIDSKPPSGQRSPPPTSIALPIDVVIADLNLGSFSYRSGTAAPTVATNITASYAYQTFAHSLNLKGITVARGTYDARVTLGARGELPLSATINGQVETPASNPRGQAVTVAVNATIKGPLRDLSIEAAVRDTTTAADSTHADVKARVKAWDPQPLVQANADFRDFDVSGFVASAPRTQLSGNVRVEPVANADQVWNVAAQIKNAIAGPWDKQRLPVADLIAQGQWRDGVVAIESLTAKTSNAQSSGEMQLSGQWSKAAWDAKAVVRNIDPASLYSTLASDSVSGTANAQTVGAGTANGAIKFDLGLKSNSGTRAVARKGLLADIRLKEIIANGQWRGEPVSRSTGTLTLSRLLVTTDDARLEGRAEVQPSQRGGSAQLSLSAPGISARVDGDLRASTGAGKADLRATDIGTAIAWLQKLPGIAGIPEIAKLQASAFKGNASVDGQWQGGWRNPAIVAKANVQSLDVLLSDVATRLRNVSLDANGTLADMRFALKGEAQQGARKLTVDTAFKAGEVVGGWQGEVSTLGLTLQDPALNAGTWRVAKDAAPTAFRWNAGTLEVSSGKAQLFAPSANAAPALIRWEPIAYGAGSLKTAGHIDGLPLAWIELFQKPGDSKLGITGDLIFGGQWDVSLGNSMQITASLARTGGDISMLAENVDGGSTRVVAGVKQAKVTVTSNGERVQADLLWDSERAGSASGHLATRLAHLETGWQWPADAPLEGDLKAQLPRVGIWSQLAPPGWRLRGSLLANVTVAGTRSAPQLGGTLQADDLALRSIVDGIELTNGRLRATLDGTRMRIEEFSLEGGGPKGTGGKLTATGQAGWVDGKPQVQLQATLAKLHASIRSDRELTVSGTIDGRVDAQAAMVRGQLTVDQARIILPAEDTPALGDDVVVRTANTVAAGKDAPAKTADVPAPESTRTIDLNVKIDLGRDFRITGKGIDTRARGTLEIAGTSLGSPRITGTVQTFGGEYRAYGQRLDVETGVIRFTGSPTNPSLDILAIRPNMTQRVGVQITGTALLPRVRLYSSPALTDAETLSWLVVGRASASGGAEAALLQQAAVALLGSKNSATSGGIASAFGLDELSFRGSSTSTSDGTASGGAVTLGKRFSRNFYAAYERSLSGALGTLFVFYDLTQRITLRGQAGQQSAVDLIYTLQYD